MLIAVLNGLTPYTEVKTAYSFNMYANLVTSKGESNHFLVRSTWPLRNGYEGPVEILESSDEGLNAYRDEGYLVAYPQLRRYLSVRPDASLTYRRYGEVVTLAQASLDARTRGPGSMVVAILPAAGDRHPQSATLPGRLSRCPLDGESQVDRLAGRSNAMSRAERFLVGGRRELVIGLAAFLALSITTAT